MEINQGQDLLLQLDLAIQETVAKRDGTPLTQVGEGVVAFISSDLNMVELLCYLADVKAQHARGDLSELAVALDWRRLCVQGVDNKMAWASSARAHKVLVGFERHLRNYDRYSAATAQPIAQAAQEGLASDHWAYDRLDGLRREFGQSALSKGLAPLLLAQLRQGAVSPTASTKLQESLAKEWAHLALNVAKGDLAHWVKQAQIEMQTPYQNNASAFALAAFDLWRTLLDEQRRTDRAAAVECERRVYIGKHFPAVWHDRAQKIVTEMWVQDIDQLTRDDLERAWEKAPPELRAIYLKTKSAKIFAQERPGRPDATAVQSFMADRKRTGVLRKTPKCDG